MMLATLIGTPKGAILASLAGGSALAAGALLLLPGGRDLTSAMLRVKSAVPPVASPAAPSRTPAVLAGMFARGERLTLPELRWLLASSAPTADIATLTAITGKIEAQAPIATEQVTWDILNAGRPQVARAFLEQRPDRERPDLWPLRFELAQRSGDLAGARQLIHAAAVRPGSAPPAQFVAAAFAADLPEAIVTAAEHHAIPAPTLALSRDLARRAVALGQPGLIARIDRIGTAAWREADPWLAMDLARRAGDLAGALRYAALLPSGSAEARRALVLASGDRGAIRTLLLEEGQTGGNRAVIAQQLVEAGFRSDAIALLKADCAGRSASDPAAQRLLYLMGPRPDAAGLAWLRARAQASPDWRQAWLEREKPAAALAFLAAEPGAATTAGLIQRLRAASAAHDRAAGLALVAQLLDDRPLTPAQTTAIAASAPPRLDRQWTLALARARVANGAASPQDRLDLAWDAWNHGRAEAAEVQLRPYLAARPNDLAALRLMADISRKQAGEGAARGWLVRALALTAPQSVERAELLERLGRTGEALPIVEQLHRAAPGNARLTAFYGRLLVAAGDPGRARKVLQP